MTCYRPLHFFLSAQRGISIIEALMALLVLAVGVLGLAQVQTRMMVETRTTNARATAIRLIADLSERIRLNATGAQPAANGLSPYSDAAGGFPDVVAATPPSDCSPASAIVPSAACSPRAQTAYDLWAWRQEVANALIDGQASVWQVSPCQLRIIIAWQLNENTNPTLFANPGSAIYYQLPSPLQISSGADTTSTDLCVDPSHAYICHVDFIDIPPAL